MPTHTWTQITSCRVQIHVYRQRLDTCTRACFCDCYCVGISHHHVLKLYRDPRRGALQRSGRPHIVCEVVMLVRVCWQQEAACFDKSRTTVVDISRARALSNSYMTVIAPRKKHPILQYKHSQCCQGGGHHTHMHSQKASYPSVSLPNTASTCTKASLDKRRQQVPLDAKGTPAHSPS
jgi:hypothetical protein